MKQKLYLSTLLLLAVNTKCSDSTEKVGQTKSPQNRVKKLTAKLEAQLRLPRRKNQPQQETAVQSNLTPATEPMGITAYNSTWTAIFQKHGASESFLPAIQEQIAKLTPGSSQERTRLVMSTIQTVLKKAKEDNIDPSLQEEANNLVSQTVCEFKEAMARSLLEEIKNTQQLEANCLSLIKQTTGKRQRTTPVAPGEFLQIILQETKIEAESEC